MINCIYYVFQPTPLVLQNNAPAHKELVAKVALRDCGFTELSHILFPRPGLM